MNRPKNLTRVLALRQLHYVTHVPRPHWSTFAIKKVAFITNCCWFFGFIFIAYLVYLTFQQFRAVTQRTRILSGEIARLQNLNSHTSANAMELAHQMFSVVKSGRDTEREFLEFIVPEALRIQVTHGVPASATVAMAIYESNYGKSKLATNHYNYFGIKAAESVWDGPKAQLPTKDNGQSNLAYFRCYPDPRSAVLGYAEFLRSSERYKDAFVFRNGEKFAQSILQAGYCPDQDYIQNIKTIMQRHQLFTLDLPEIPGEKTGQPLIAER
jgi:flagellum-specific peptidoglycan hydrolase FlgJ